MQVGFCQLRWDDKAFGGHGCWYPAEGVSSFIDFRTFNDGGLRGQYGEQSRCFVLSEAPLQDASYVQLADGHPLDVRTDKRTLDTWEAITGVRPQGDRVADLVKWYLTFGADPLGESTCHLLQPNDQSILEVVCGSMHVQEFFYFGKHSYTDRLKTKIQHQFSALWEESNGADYCRRILDALCVQYGVTDWKTFVPKRLQKEVPGRLPFKSSVDDPFTHADVSPATNWTDVAGTSSIKSNTFCPTGSSTFGHFYHATAMSSSDTEAYVTNAALPGTANLGACVRMSTSQQTCYGCWGLKTVTNQVAVYYVNNATPTELGFRTSGVAANGDVMLCGINGNTLYGKQNGTQFYSNTHTGIGSGVRVGLECYNPNAASTSVAQDDFHGNDIVTTFTGSSSLTVGNATLAAAATFTKPTYSGAAALQTGSATLAGTSTSDLPHYTGAAVLQTGNATLAGAATFTKPTYSGIAALTKSNTLLSAAASAPFAPHSLRFFENQYLDLGPGIFGAGVERNVSFSVLAYAAQDRIPSSDFSAVPVLITQATDSPFTTWIEIWYRLVSGKVVVCVRLIATDPTQELSVYGDVDIGTGLKVVIGVTYDGSADASGVTVRTNGVLNTLTTEYNTLAGHSTVTSDNLIIGNQRGIANPTEDTFYCDNVGPCYLYKGVVKDSSFFAQFADPEDAPPSPIGADGAYLMEGPSDDPTVIDASGNGNDGELTDPACWSRLQYQTSVSNRRLQATTPASTNNSTSDLVMTFGEDVVAGSLLVAEMKIRATGVNLALSDDQGNDWNLVNYVVNGAVRVGFFWAIATQDGPCEVTVHPSGAASVAGTVVEHSGPWPADPVEDTVSNSGSSGTPMIGTLVPAGPGRLFVGIAGHNANSSTAAHGDAFLREGRLNDAQHTFVSQGAYRDESTLVDFGGSWGASNPWAAMGVMFAPEQPAGSAVLTKSNPTLSGAATFTKPTYAGTAILQTGSPSLAAVAGFTRPTYSGAAALQTGGASLAASAVFSPAVSLGVAALTAGHPTMSAAAEFTPPTDVPATVVGIGYRLPEGRTRYRLPN